MWENLEHVFFAIVIGAALIAAIVSCAIGIFIGWLFF